MHGIGRSKPPRVNEVAVRDLGVFLDSELMMKSHVSRITSACFYRLRRSIVGGNIDSVLLYIGGEEELLRANAVVYRRRFRDASVYLRLASIYLQDGQVT